MALSSRTFRILVSSNSSDLAEEHNILHAEVFPKLQEQCRRSGWRFRAVDLRWEDSLAEIARCRAASPRPSFMCLLGDRYGARPLPAAIPAAEFDAIEKRMTGVQAAFLREWYRLDENAVPPVRVLDRPRGVFSQAAVWERAVEAPLRALLAEAARGLGLAAADRLKYEASAVEQETQAALVGAEQASGQVVCLSRVPVPRRAGVDAEADGRLQALKRQLRGQLGRDYYEYEPESLGTFAAMATAALARIIQAEGGGRASAEDEEAAHAAFGRERARHFAGRARAVGKIAEYLHGADAHPLVVAGPPGSGKSALLAHSVERYRALRREATVVYRSAGATAESADGRALLANVCRRLDAEGLESAGYVELMERFPERLAAAAARGPAMVVLDGIEHLPEFDQTRNLEWLPATLPAGARLVVSAASGATLAKLRKKVPAANVVELEPLAAEAGGRLLDLWLKADGRTLTPAQKERVIESFRACPLPLYLRLAFEDARRWRSFDPADTFPAAPDVAGQIDNALARLQARHGRPLVWRCLGYLAASRLGLAEDELFDLLSRDGLATAATWPPLLADLRPYLAERAADGATLLVFAHPEFSQAFGQGSLARDDCRDRRLALARHFDDCGYPARRFTELARQQALGAQWTEIEATLTSFEFVEGKVNAGLLRDLIEDYRIADACWRAEKLGAPPWREWGRFLASQANTIESRFEEYPQILFQQAFNHSRQGRVSSAAQARLRDGRQPPQPWFERVNRPELPPGQDSLAAFEGHRGPVSSVLLSRDGARAVSGGADGTLRVWSLTAGACVRILRGHTSGVMALAPVGEDGVVSAAWDSSLRVWDLNTGECMHVLGADTCPVVALAQTGPERVASGAVDGSLRLWDLAGGGCVATMQGHRDRINSILPLGGGRIASASDDGSIRVWEADGSQAGILTGHGGPVLHLCRLADGALAASSRSGTIVLWDIETAKVRDILKGHLGAVTGVTPFGAARLVSWSHDNTLRVWSLVDGSQLMVLARHTGAITRAETLADGRLLSASHDGTLRLWDSTGEALGIVGRHRSWVNAMAVASSLAISAGRDETLRVWDLDAAIAEQAARPVEAPADVLRARRIESVYVVDPATAVSAASEPESLQAWDLEEGRCAQSVAGDSAAGQRLRQRIRAATSAVGPSYCGGPRSEWGYAITGAAHEKDQPARGLALTRERQREGGMFDYESRPLAFYPLVCQPYSWTFECERGIAFDARTREPHIVKAHNIQVAAPDKREAPQAGGARSLLRRFLGHGEKA